MIHERSLSTSAVCLNVAQGPAAGPPLVLLHGVTRQWRDLTPVFDEFSSRREVFAIDFRGHGKSGPATDYRTIDYVADAVALVRDIACPDNGVVLYGHSLGAMVAAAVAAELPERVQGVILEDPPWDTLGGRISETAFHSFFAGMQQVACQISPPSSGPASAPLSSVAAIAAALAEIVVKSPEAETGVRLGDIRDGASLRFSAACLMQMDPAVLAPVVAGQWLQGYDRTEVLSAVRCPALLLQADYSAGGMLPDHEAARAAALLVAGTHIKLDGVGHLMHWQARERVLTLMNQFIESLT